MTRMFWMAIAGSLAAAAGHGAELRPETRSFYDGYLKKVESELAARPKFLKIDAIPELRERVRGGTVHVQERRAPQDPPDGLIHHWEGAVFVPNTKLGEVLKLIQDYDRHKQYYSPEVRDSQTLKRNGNEFLIRLKLVTKKVVTVAFDTEHQVRYKPLDARRWESISNTVKMAELDKPLTSQEKELPQGTGRGYVWSMDSYWRFEEADGGVYLECTSVSLSRDIPFGMARLIRPIIENFPEDSLRNVLSKTRTAIQNHPRVAEHTAQ